MIKEVMALQVKDFLPIIISVFALVVSVIVLLKDIVLKMMEINEKNKKYEINLIGFFHILLVTPLNSGSIMFINVNVDNLFKMIHECPNEKQYKKLIKLWGIYVNLCNIIKSGKPDFYQNDDVLNIFKDQITLCCQYHNMSLNPNSVKESRNRYNIMFNHITEVEIKKIVLSVK